MVITGVSHSLQRGATLHGIERDARRQTYVWLPAAAEKDSERKAGLRGRGRLVILGRELTWGGEKVEGGGGYLGGLLSNLISARGLLGTTSAVVLGLTKCWLSFLRAREAATNARHLQTYFAASAFRS